MLRFAIAATAAVFAVTAYSAIETAASGAPAAPAVTRKVLLTQDTTPGQQAVEIMVDIPVGGREGKHTHPGALVVYVQEGNLTLDYEGKPTVTYKPGEVFYVEAGKVHEGINNGQTPIKAIATYIGVKGPPLTTQVQ